ncbi:MAG TPA: radical SAM protein [Candidatus Hydrogenedentes bacterium]|nr:radical SAM protein [Candidatus Hydrogenedentota bacterium]HPG66312.1 radical SAM protein [Candidatus Hydrogenedentota bacterium]
MMKADHYAAKAERIEAILDQVEEGLKSCALCGHRCGVDRLAGRAGMCRAGGDPRVARYSSHTRHFGEEPMLVGRGGSGTVFFTCCNLRCVFCQNHQISQEGLGTEIDTDALADIFLELEAGGAENINLVTPTHGIYPILLSLRTAYKRGLAIPLVYNTNGYDSLELIEWLDGIVDVYLPDMKYMDEAKAVRYSAAEGYPGVAQRAIAAMYRQVGAVQLEDGVAQRGLIIRHLVLPNDLANSYDFLLWLKDAGLVGATVGIMSQYSPQYRAHEFVELNGRVRREEYRAIVDYAAELGFENILAQGLDSHEAYLPDFRRREPFREGY